MTGYFSNCAPARPGKLAGNAAVEARLWEVSAELTGVGRDGQRKSAPGA